MLWLTLCAGEQTRFVDEMGADFRKQLIQVHGEPLIHRQRRQVAERGHDLVMVTHDALLMDAATTTYNRIIVPEARRWTCETLRSTAQHWPEESGVTVLLGDVYYTDALMDAIAACQLPVAFFGNIAETWAIVATDLTRLYDACMHTIEACEREEAVGSLRNVYHSLMGLPYQGNAYEPEFQFEALESDNDNWRQPPESVWRYWSDETCDFDEPRHLRRVATLEYGK